MTQEKIARINELARKSKSIGLSETEKVEQQALRAEYIADFKANIRNQMNNIDLVDANGNVENVGEMLAKKNM